MSLLPSGSGEKRDLQRVVLARFADVHAIGFVTREDVPPVSECARRPRLGHRIFPHELCLRRIHHLPAARSHSAPRHFRRRCHALGDHRGPHGCRQPRRRLGPRSPWSSAACWYLHSWRLMARRHGRRAPQLLRPPSRGREISGLESRRRRQFSSPAPMRNSLATAAALRFLGAANAKRRRRPQLKASAVDLAARAASWRRRARASAGCICSCAPRTPACDIRDVATVMRWVDADNGAAWLQTLSRGAEGQRYDGGRQDSRRTWLLGARFDFYWNRIVVLMVDALDAVGYDLPSGLCRIGRSETQARSAESRAARSFRLSRHWWKRAGNRAPAGAARRCV